MAFFRLFGKTPKLDWEETKMKKTVTALTLSAALALTLTACGSGSGGGSTAPEESAATGLEDGVFTVAMECNYAPFNWTQSDDSNGAVPISGGSDYAYGYDVKIPNEIADPADC